MERHFLSDIIIFSMIFLKNVTEAFLPVKCISALYLNKKAKFFTEEGGGFTQIFS